MGVNSLDAFNEDIANNTDYAPGLTDMQEYAVSRKGLLADVAKNEDSDIANKIDETQLNFILSQAFRRLESRQNPEFFSKEKVKDFFDNSGVSFYLAQYEQAIGTNNGIRANYEGILEQFRQLNVPVARVWLTLGSKSNSGIDYGPDGSPIGFKNEALAVQDFKALVEIAKATNTKLVVTLHNHDLSFDHQDIFSDPQKRKAMIDLDQRLLARTLRELGDDVRWIEAVEILNEPDNTHAELADVQNFVREGIEMVRGLDVPLPISLGTGKIRYLKDWAPMLQAGDTLQIHWYVTDTDMSNKLIDDISDLSGILPEGVDVVLGEIQPNIGGESIVSEMLQTAFERNFKGAYFWFDNFQQKGGQGPDFVFDSSDFHSTKRSFMQNSVGPLAFTENDE